MERKGAIIGFSTVIRHETYLTHCGVRWPTIKYPISCAFSDSLFFSGTYLKSWAINYPLFTSITRRHMFINTSRGDNLFALSLSLRHEYFTDLEFSICRSNDAFHVLEGRESFLHAYYTRNKCLAWIMNHIKFKDPFFISSPFAPSSFSSGFVASWGRSGSMKERNIYISSKDFVLFWMKAVAWLKVNVINSFIGFEHETAGNLLIFISAFLWAHQEASGVRNVSTRP